MQKCHIDYIKSINSLFTGHQSSHFIYLLLLFIIIIITSKSIFNLLQGLDRLLLLLLLTNFISVTYSLNKNFKITFQTKMLFITKS